MNTRLTLRVYHWYAPARLVSGRPEPKPASHKMTGPKTGCEGLETNQRSFSPPAFKGGLRGE